MEVLEICWLGPKSNGLDLIRVNRNSYLTNDVSQVGQLVLCEGAVATPDMPLILSQQLKKQHASGQQGHHRCGYKTICRPK